MDWTALGMAGLGAAGDIFGGLGGQSPVPNMASSGGLDTPVSVSVGGLNVPTYPDFPRFSNSTAGQVQQPTVINDDRLYYLAGAAVLAVVILRLAK